jgi:hypothetical protein
MRMGRCAVLFWLALGVLLSGCREEKDPGMDLSLLDEVHAITVKAETGGTVLVRLEDPSAIQELLEGLRNAPLSYIEGPEPSGARYHVQFEGDQAVQTVQVNDLRNTDALYLSGKVYVKADNGMMTAWKVSSAWISKLLGHTTFEADSPFLEVSVFDDSATVIVQANRRIRTESVHNALKETLKAETLNPAEAELPAYTVQWSDPYRFAVRFVGLEGGTTLRMRFDGLIAAAGERFSDSGFTYEAVVNEEGTKSRFVWVNLAGDVEREVLLDPAILVQPIEDTTEIRAYHMGGKSSRMDWTTGAAQEEGLLEGVQVKESFGNDNGSNVLYSNRKHGDAAYAVIGNRTLFRIDASGNALMLYESSRPVYGIASSPDGQQVALLVASELSLGAYADLIIVDSEGTESLNIPKASYMAKSDGYLIAYPLTWADRFTVAAPWVGNGTVGFSRGRSLIDSAHGTMHLEANAALPAKAADLLAPYLKKHEEVVRFVPESGGDSAERYAAQTSDQSCWLVDLRTDRLVWLGEGLLIAWAGEGRIVIYDSVDGLGAAYLGVDDM